MTTGSKSSPLDKAAAEAVEVLRKGGLILYPTDTVWGVGCDATNEEAVQRVYALKRSENKHAMICLCASADMVVRYVNRAPAIAFEVMELATTPLTLVLPAAVAVASGLVPEDGSLAVRVPDHAFCQAVLKRLGRPLVSTSANLSGGKPAVTLKEVVGEIADGVDWTAPLSAQGNPTNHPSSMMRFEADGSFQLIR